MCRMSRNSGSLNLLEHYWPVHACNGIALPFRVVHICTRHTFQYCNITFGVNQKCFSFFFTFFRVLLKWESHMYYGRVAYCNLAVTNGVELWSCCDLRKSCKRPWIDIIFEMKDLNSERWRKFRVGAPNKVCPAIQFACYQVNAFGLIFSRVFWHYKGWMDKASGTKLTQIAVESSNRVLARRFRNRSRWYRVVW
jgi:hypothetical protein